MTTMQGITDELSRILATGDRWGSLGGKEAPSPELALDVTGELAAWYDAAAPQQVSVPWFVEWLTFYDPSELWECQEGYRYSSGQAEQAEPDWDPAWVVIGDCSSDPIIVDTTEPACPVLLATHGTGKWAPLAIVPSLTDFLTLLIRWLEFWLQVGGVVRDENGELSDSGRNALFGSVTAHLGEEYRENFGRFVR